MSYIDAASPQYPPHFAGNSPTPEDEELFPIEEEEIDTTDEDMRAIISSEIEDAQTFIDYDISDQRTKATQYYRGEPFGDEEEGRSQFVSRDVHDTVNGILPSLMRMFFGSEKVVEFVPQGPEDVEMAEQATDYVNFIVQRDNPGFSVFWDAFKDALVRKCGVIKYWWDESVEVTTQEYTGLDEQTVQKLLEDLNTSVEASVENMTTDEQGQISLTVKLKKRKDRARLCAVPPEEFLIDRHARTVDDARFVAHRCIKTVSDLVAMGYAREDVEDAAGDTFEDLSFNQERLARQESDFTTPLDTSPDKSQSLVLYYECYVRADMDDDGIAELRKVCAVGSGYKILHNEPVDERPFAALCPDPEPHTFFGGCPGENVMDIQKYKSSLLRATTDGIAFSLYPRTVVKTGTVNMSDVLNTEYGAIIRADSSVEDVKALTIPFSGDKSFPMLEYMDRIRENRTGMSRVSMGLDAEALQNTTATAASAQFTQGQQHIELIARIFAETGMKRLFRGLLRLVAKNQRQQRMVNLRNQWVPIDPRGWKTDMDVTANVALGGGSPQEKMQILSLIAQKQEGILLNAGPDNPICGFAEYRETLSKMTELAGFKNIDAFWKDPAQAAQQPQQPPPPDPAMVKVQAEMQAKQAELQMKGQSDQAQMQLKAQMDQQGFQLKQQQLVAEMQLKREQLQAEMQLKREAMVAELQLKRELGIMQTQQTSASLSEVNMGGVPG